MEFNKIIKEKFDVIKNEFERIKEEKNNANFTIPFVIYKEILEKYSNKIDIHESENNLTSCCCKGCYGCCRQIIIVSDIEKEFIRLMFKKMSIINKIKFMLKVLEVKKHLEYCGIYYDCLDNIHSEEDIEKLKNIYFNEKINCVFLDKDGSCSVYNSRFIACMTYRSYGNRKDCFNSLNYNEAVTYNNIEKELRKEFTDKTGSLLIGYNILPYACYDAIKEYFSLIF